MPDYKSIRSLSRGLFVLRSLSEAGPMTALSLSKKTDLPRATVYRLLETLVSENLVRRIEGSDHFCLSSDIMELSHSFEDYDLASEVAAPIIADCGKSLRWPVVFFVPDKKALTIRLSTHASSPFALYSNIDLVGLRVPIVETSPGRSYLAGLPNDKRENLFDELLPRDNRAEKIDGISGILGAVQRLGCGFRHEGIQPRTSSIAVPVTALGEMVGFVTLVFYTSAMTIQNAAHKHLPELDKTARIISRELEDRAQVKIRCPRTSRGHLADSALERPIPLPAA